MKYTIILPLLVLLSACEEPVARPAQPTGPTEAVICDEADLGPNEYCN